jgi:hypothetical protein
MRVQKTGSKLMVIMAFAAAFTALAKATETPRAAGVHRVHASHHRHANVSYAATAEGAPGPSGFVDLSQDSGSGAGFYPLPQPYRADARRHRAIQYAGERNAIGTAIASEAIGYDWDEGYAFGNSHGVFDPDDGVGTPFFAGYYN